MTKLAVMQPFKHQHHYITSTHRHPSIVAGYGAGKTYSNLIRVIYLLQRRNKEGIKPYIVYGAPTYDLIQSTFYPEFLEMLELCEIRYKERASKKTIEILNKGLKGTVKYLSLDNYKYLVGFSATDMILDEFDVIPFDRQQPTWRRCLARLRGCEDASLALTTTPEGHKFVYQLYSEGKLDMVNVPTSANRLLPQSYMDELIANYDDVHKQLYFDGKFVNLSGMQAIYQFDESRIIDPLPKSTLPPNITIGMDFNVDPFTISVSCMKNGVKITFDEFYIRNLGGAAPYETYTDKAVNLLLQKYPTPAFARAKNMGDVKTFNIEIKPDMTGGARKTSAGITDLAILKKYSLTIKGTTNPFVSERLKVSNAAMAKGQWLITSNCKELKKDLEYSVVDQYGELVKDKDNMRGHILDAVTYDVFWDFKDMYGNKTRPKTRVA